MQRSWWLDSEPPVWRPERPQREEATGGSTAIGAAAARCASLVAGGRTGGDLDRAIPMIDALHIGGWGRIALAGDFDVVNSGEIADVAAEMISAGATDVAVDMSEVTFLGAAGINALVNTRNQLTGVDGRIVVVGASGEVRRILRVVGLDARLRVAVPPDVDPAPILAGQEGAAAPDRAGGDLSAQVYALAQVLLGEQTVMADLSRIVTAATRVVPGCTAATVALVAQGTSRTAAVSDPVAIEVDVAQYRTGEGPCLDATRISDLIRVEVLAAGDRFVHFAPLAVDAGVHEVLSLPVVVSKATVASLNLYAADRFGAGAEDAAQVLTSQIGIAVSMPGITDALRRLADSIQHRVDDERSVNVARGVLAGLRSCSIDQSDRLLADASAAGGAGLVEAARRILAAVAEGAVQL